MSQYDYIKEITRYALLNDQEQLKEKVRGLIDYSKKINKHNFALELQYILKENWQKQAVNSGSAFQNRITEAIPIEDASLKDLILEKLSSQYSFDDLISDSSVRNALKLFVKEQQNFEYLKKFELPVSNKIFLYGPSGCGKTLAAYVLAGELDRPMYVVNVGAIVSSKLGETSKNLSRLFQKAARNECILFFDEFDTLGKLRDYSQDHAEMKRVVNTFLQLFDYLPQHVVLIAATNHAHMIDSALIRRFDSKLELTLPKPNQIKVLIKKTLSAGKFSLDNKTSLPKIIKAADGLSYYSIQRTLINAIKSSLFDLEKKTTHLNPEIKTAYWLDLIKEEKKQQTISS
ncbi:MAG TPA: AAA family ATPase [Bacteroidales bacterium]|nr:AAA family ATPase [Bacteroidales bacterium]